MFRNVSRLSGRLYGIIPRQPVQQYSGIHQFSTRLHAPRYLNHLTAAVIPPQKPQLLNQIPNHQQIRNYALPRRSRPVNVQEKTTTYERPLTKPEENQETRTTQAFTENTVTEQRTEEVKRVRQIDALTEGTKAHLRKVYSTVGTTIGLAGVGGFLAMVPPLTAIHPIIPGLLSLAPLFGVYFTAHTRENLTKRTFYLGSFGFLSGLTLGPLLKIAMLINPGLIAASAAVTAGLFGAMTALSLFMPSKSALSWGAPLGGGVLVLLGCGIASLFVPVTSVFYPILHSVFTYGGLALFTLYIAFDTQNIINDYENGNDDHVSHAIDLFIDIVGIFRRVLYIFLNRED